MKTHCNTIYRLKYFNSNECNHFSSMTIIKYITANI